MKVIFIRDGSAILISEFGERPVSVGDVVLLGPNVLCRSEPEGRITATILYVDRDYLIDQFFWRHASSLPDRYAAERVAARVYADPTQILHLGEARANILLPLLDELVNLSADGRYQDHYYRMQARWSDIADVLASHVRATHDRVALSLDAPS